EGRRLLENVANEFLRHGWEVREHSFITRKGSSTEVDILGKKGRTFVAIEVKAGSATAADIGVLSDVPATFRFIVANKWADQRLADVANKNSVRLIEPSEVESTINRLENLVGQSSETVNTVPNLTMKN